MPNLQISLPRFNATPSSKRCAKYEHGFLLKRKATSTIRIDGVTFYVCTECRRNYEGRPDATVTKLQARGGVA